MSEYEFTLVIDGDLTDEDVVRALFEAGCDDATFGVIDGVGYGAFMREAPSFADAVLSAARQVESVRSLRVRRVEPDDIVTMAEIADRLDRTRESVRLLITGKRGRGEFPAPISHTRDRGRLCGVGQTWLSRSVRWSPRTGKPHTSWPQPMPYSSSGMAFNCSTTTLPSRSSSKS